MNTTTNTRGVSEAMVERALEAFCTYRCNTDDAEGMMRAALEDALSAPEPAAQGEGGALPAELCAWLQKRDLLPNIEEDGSFDIADLITALDGHEDALMGSTPAPSAPPAQPAERVPEGWLLLPEDLWTHRHDWHKACVMARKHSPSADDKAYWTHQLKTLDNVNQAMLAASPAPSEGGKGVDDTLARELYIASQCDAHNLHTLAWHELTEKKRDEWRKKATGAAR